MTLLTEQIGQDNERRCDAKCYNAKHPSCDCVCGGKNHGAGLDRAMDNVREIFLAAMPNNVDPEIRNMLEQEQRQPRLF